MVKLVDKLGIPELTTSQIEALCTNAENAARKFIFSKISSKIVEKLNITVEAEGIKPLKLSVDLDLAIKKSEKTVDLKKLVDEAAKIALKASEEYLGHLK